VAGFAAHVQSGVTAAVLRDIHSDVVAAQAEILFRRRARSRLQKLIGIVGLVRIVTLHAIANRRGMNRLARLYLLLIVAAQAERLGGSGDQLDPGDVAIDADFVAAQAAGRDGGVNCFPFAFVFVALQALGRIHVVFEGYRVSLG